jgi:uncharacterized repeat protein (TIGR03803 family)
VGNGTVYELTPASGAWILNLLHALTGFADGSEPEGGVQLDPAGNVYGTTLEGGEHTSGTVFQVVPSGNGWKLNTLYSFQFQSNNGSYPWAGEQSPQMASPPIGMLSTGPGCDAVRSCNLSFKSDTTMKPSL